ncbi:MAG TPA: SusD/RagB family nutrient-binding outer membrane lipoprotein [Chryseolinea sp.]|nr:SusD/RagB family nutrient-binding outer membrane lipoprotein [Chryseolinea sp.]
MRKSSIFLALMVVGGLASCKKDLLDINKNPNAATSSTPQLTTPIALEGAARIVNTQYNNYAFWVGFYSGSAGFAKPGTTYTYDISSTYQAGTWDAIYNNLEDADYVEQQAIALKLPMYEGLAKVLKVIDYQQLVDQWGNVAYFDALHGLGHFTPKYDDAQAIYEDLVKKLDTAVAIFKNPATAQTILLNIDSKKIILFNNILKTTDPSTVPLFLEQWARFANTIKLKLLLQQSQIPGRDAYIKQNLIGLGPDDFLRAGEDAAVNPGYQNTKGKFSPIFSVFFSDVATATDAFNSTKASANVIDVYTNMNDLDRLGWVFIKNGPTFLGSIFGDPSGTTNAASFNRNAVNNVLLNPTRSAPIMISAESLFMQAEAAQRGYFSTSPIPQTLYEAAVQASFAYEGLSAKAGAYLAQNRPEVSWTAAPDKIQLIIGQKWLALNSINNLTVYNDYRRTGFPVTSGATIQAPLSTDPNSKGKVPIRMFYPQNEALYNTDNVLAQGNIDVFNTPIFWDK